MWAALPKIFDTVRAPLHKFYKIIHKCKTLTAEIQNIKLFVICIRILFVSLSLCCLLGMKLNRIKYSYVEHKYSKSTDMTAAVSI
jgi:hypothetical protein